MDVETHQIHKGFVTDHIQASKKKAQNIVLSFFLQLNFCSVLNLRNTKSTMCTTNMLNGS